MKRLEIQKALKVGRIPVGDTYISGPGFPYLSREGFGLNNCTQGLASWKINWFSSFLFTTTDTPSLVIATVAYNLYCLETPLEQSEKLQRHLPPGKEKLLSSF